MVIGGQSRCALFARSPRPAGAGGEETGLRDWGRVTGYVLDTATGGPLLARVVVEEGGAFADRGPTTGQTNAEGRYQCARTRHRTWT